MKKFYGNYVGIVVQNDDPEHRGRCKIFVPHVNVTLYEEWNQTADKFDKNFAFPDQELNPDLDKVLTRLKNVLPWGECAAPLFGGSASGRYQAFTRQGSVSDSSFWEKREILDSEGNLISDEARIDGNRPLQNYTEDNAYNDEFIGYSPTKNKYINRFGREYTPSNYSNLARGLFTIPNVGAHVWVFFTGGDPRYPVYFAVSHNKEDWNRIYTNDQGNIYEEDESGNLQISNTLFTSTDYPDACQNLDNDVKDATLDENTKTFRAKTVLNSNKHALEFIDTDDHEILKMTHFSGSFKEFTNYANIELAQKNDQKMVIGDQFLTVRKNQSIYIANNRELIVAEDSYRSIGAAHRKEILPAANILKNIHTIKQLFDIKRIPAYGPMLTSSLQTQVGEYAACPTCGGVGYQPGDPDIQNYFRWDIIPDWLTIFSCLERYDPEFTIGFGTYKLYTDRLIAQLESVTGERGYYLGLPCDSCSRALPRCLATTGESPSTEDGAWETEERKLVENLQKLYLEKTEELYEAERITGEGDEVTEIVKNKIETVGLVMNDMEPYRVDPIGKVKLNGVHTAIEGTYPTYKATQLVEFVDVDDVPGGDYNLNVANKYKLLVGARGINIKTFGPLDMYAPVMNIAGQQVNITSKGEINIGGENPSLSAVGHVGCERITMRARQISLQPDNVTQTPAYGDICQPEGASVLVDGNLHVKNNTIHRGGVMVEGELGLLHVTAPFEWHLTEPSQPIKTEPAIEYCYTDNNGNVSSTHIHYIRPHQHYFQNLPIDFYPANEFVRWQMVNEGINTNIPVSAQSLSVFTSADALSAGQIVTNNPWRQGQADLNDDLLNSL